MFIHIVATPLLCVHNNIFSLGIKGIKFLFIPISFLFIITNELLLPASEKVSYFISELISICIKQGKFYDAEFMKHDINATMHFCPGKFNSLGG